MFEKSKVAMHTSSRKTWMIAFSLVLVVIVGGIFLPGGTLLHVFAAGVTPTQPTSVNGIPAQTGVNLTWGASTGATGYEIEQTDLATGNVQILPDIVQGTSFSPGSLAEDHWYRFRIIPVNGATQGTPSAPIEIRTSGFQNPYSHYYALGDSYSAGEGAPPYTNQTCHHSNNTYSFLLNDETPRPFDMPTPDLIACSSATTGSIDQTAQQGTPGTQLQQLKSQPQGDVLVTLTIGGNDIGFSSVLKSCILSFHSCTSMQASVSQKITALEPRLVQVYKEIRQASPAADIVVLGYPLLVADPAHADCHNPIMHVGLSAAEMTMIRTLAHQLNTVIAQAAAQAGVVSATSEVESAFAGHEMCAPLESNEWINEITGLNDNLAGTAHPELAGYEAYASVVDQALYALDQTGMVRD
jgi:lysophospholipase L1-like esterase